jgi:predicted O-methyltransferase YrrM
MRWNNVKREENASLAKPEHIVPEAYQVGSPSFDLTSEGLVAWARSSAFRAALALSKPYDVYDSLQSNNSRAFLYHLIMTLRPERVLEIGTFRAGTARFLANALHHAGRGELYTIDPFGLENNVPSIIEAWPAHLQERVHFSPISSAEFFDKAMIAGLMFDLVLIDGNHEFEYAAFDLACSARLMNAGGVAVLDNVDQPGPRFATQQFLVANPGWNEIPGTAADPVAEDEGIAKLPALPQSSGCRLVWEAIEGLTVSERGSGPVPGFVPLILEATSSDGYHRVGIHFAGLATNRKYRFAVWLSPLINAFAKVDFRDAQSPSSEIFCDLVHGLVDRQAGPIETARMERRGKWNRLLIDFYCPSGKGYIYVFVQSGRGEILFRGSSDASVAFGGLEILSQNDRGEFEPAVSANNFVRRDLRKLDAADPFGYVAPSFPDTKFFALRAPAGMEVSNIPRSFGSIISEIGGVRWLELELVSPAAGTLHYQIFCRAFSDIAQPEELTSLGSAILKPEQSGKVRIEIANPLKLAAPRAHAHYRIEVILAFISKEADGHLYLRHPPRTSESN